jgi:hypothetical protein
MELLLTERIIIESISKNCQTLKEIKNDTGLESTIVHTLVPELIMKNIVSYIDGKYFLNMKESKTWLKEINNLKNTKNEIKDILLASVELLEKEKSLNMKKVYLTPYEEKILNIELSKVEKFISQIQRERSLVKGNNRTTDMKVIYWGFSNYGDLVEEDLKYV